MRAWTAALFLVLPAASSPAGFSLKDEPGKHLDVLSDGRVVGRYMYAWDKSSPQTLLETYKPYLHIFDAEGKAPVTKGPGGSFTHHRGIFVGWNKLGFGGKTYDRWHMKGGEQVHQKFMDQKADAAQASFTSLVHWNDEAVKPILEEERTMTFLRPPSGAYALIELATKLKVTAGDLVLDGDPEHAGVQYRPANEVDPKATVYVFPREGAVPTKDLDYPWVGETYSLGGKKYSVAILNHPGNPKSTRFSAYRDYGRFGAFFKAEIKAGQALALKYRFLVAEGEMPQAEAIQAASNEFTEEKIPVPKVTVIPAAKK
jgi:hypothetical protein